MVEGMSIRAIARMTGASKNTIIKLLADAGNAFMEYQDKALRQLPCKRLQCDEIWSFIYAKDKNAPAELKELGEAGDVWTWTAIDVDSKLIASWMVGDRTVETAKLFMVDVAERLAGHVQLTTDGHKAYLAVTREAFLLEEIDYTMLQELYGKTDSNTPERKYSPGECCGTIKGTVCRNPDEAHISTSYIERQNLSMRMRMRRFTRLTNGFSKKLENHVHALSIYFMHYNFARVHQTLRVTPAMEAGIAKSPMTFADMVAIVDAAAPKPSKRGPYKKIKAHRQL